MRGPFYQYFIFKCYLQLFDFWSKLIYVFRWNVTATDTGKNEMSVWYPHLIEIKFKTRSSATVLWLVLQSISISLYFYALTYYKINKDSILICCHFISQVITKFRIQTWRKFIHCIAWCLRCLERVFEESKWSHSARYGCAE